MKALSIRQPWASLIIAGIKPVENRTWKSNYRGPLLIHASKVFDREALKWIAEKYGYDLFNPDYQIALASQEERGGIIGAVNMIDCVTYHPSEWFFGPKAFVFENPKELPFMPCPGKLSFFDVEYVLPGMSL
jgi:hypothetical protein